MDEENKFPIVAPGDSVADAISTLRRVIRRLGRRAKVLQLRYDRDKSEKNAAIYCDAAAEYYYVSRLASEFSEAAVRAVERKTLEDDEKKKDMN